MNNDLPESSTFVVKTELPANNLRLSEIPETQSDDDSDESGDSIESSSSLSNEIEEEEKTKSEDDH